MSTGQEGESGDGVLTTGAGSGGAGPRDLGGKISVQELMRALASVTPAGKRPPRLEGSSLTREKIPVFFREHDGYYCDQMRRCADGVMPQYPVGVLELIGPLRERSS